MELKIDLSQLGKKSSPLLDYLLIAIALLYSGHALGASTSQTYGRVLFLLGAIAFALVAFYVLYTKRITLSPATVVLLVWSGLLLLNFIFHSSTEAVLGYFGKFSQIVIPFVLCAVIPQKSFREKYVKTLFFISLFSLLCFYFLANTPLWDSFPFLRGYGIDGKLYNKFQGFLLYYRADEWRNSGPFWEPGIFASHLVLSMLLCRNIQLKHKWLYYVVFTITILSTSSSAGYLLLVLVALYLIASQLNNQKRFSTRVLFTCFVLLMCVLVLFAYFNMADIIKSLGLADDPVFEKLLDLSDSERAKAFTWNIEQTLASPLIGHGYTGLSLLPIPTGSHCLDTATSLRLMAVFGLLGALYTAFLAYGVLKQKGDLISRLLLLFILILIVNKEGQDAFLIMWMLILHLNSSKQFLSDEEAVA